MNELFSPFRLAYMDNYLNDRNGGEAGVMVMRRLLEALEQSMVAGIDVVKTKDPTVGELVGKLQAALVAELTPITKDS